MLLAATSLALSALPAVESANVASPKDGDAAPVGHMKMPRPVDEGDDALQLEVAYTGEVMANLSGGVQRGARYLDNLDIIVDADLDRLAGWSGATVHLYGLYNNGRSISALAGDAQTVSNIETGVRALRLYEAWIDQAIGDVASLKLGLYDLNSEFDALDAAGLFVSSPHGIGTDFAQSGENGPSIFPATSLAARLQLTPAEGWAVRAAILDGVPGDPEHPARTAIHLGGGDGALLVGEVEAPLAGGKLLVGHWRYTADFALNDGSGSASGNAGTYVRAEMPLSDSDGRRVDGFMRLGQASGRFNMFGAFWSGGVNFGGWVPGRDADAFGLAFAAAFTSDSYRRATGAGPSEVAFEATYRARLNSWLSVQPSAHYVRNPAAAPGVADALLLGLRVEAAFSL